MRLPSTVLSVFLVCAAGSPAAAEFPDRPIQIVVPFAAGGGTDITARLLAQSLERQFGNGRVVVVNKPGAGGEIGMAAVAEAAPDGYTLGILNTPNLLSLPVERKTRFAVGDFDLIANVADDPGTFSVRTDSPVKSLADLIAAARKAPDTITFGSAGIGSAGHIAMLLFQRAAEFKGKNVPFNGTSAVRTALLSGEIAVATANLGEALTFARGQPWRILGVMSLERSLQARDLPTFAEQGFKIESGSLRGLGAPKGLPADVRSRLIEAVDKAVDDPKFVAAAKAAEQPIRYLRRDAYAAVLAATDKQLRDLWAVSPWQQ